MLKIDKILRRETKKKHTETIWNNFIFPVLDFSVTEGNVKFESEKISEKFENLKMLWHFFEILRIDEIFC